MSERGYKIRNQQGEKYLIILGVVLLGLLIYFLPKLLFLTTYSAGNVPSFSCVTTEKNYTSLTFNQYLDTFLIKNPEYQNPTDIDIRNEYPHLHMVGFYFQYEPEEMYEVSVSSASFSCVRYLVKMRNGKKLYNIENPTKKDNERMKKRLKEVWNKVEKLIEESNLPDSVKYEIK